MSEATTGQVNIQAAEVYEEFFVPALFAQWTDRVLERGGVGPGDRVLDVGCGTGVLARAARERVGPTGQVTGVDPNEGMRAVARQRCPGVRLEDGYAEDLPFPDDAFDRVLSQFALMFFTDQRAAVREMSRVLRPGGRLVVLTWVSIEASPGYSAMAALLRRLFGEEPARALLAPFTIGTPELLESVLAPTFPGVRVERVAGEARFSSLEDWIRTDVKGWTLRDMIDDEQYARLQTEASRELARFAGPSGVARFEAPALVAWWDGAGNLLPAAKG